MACRIKLMREFEAHAGQVTCLSVGRKSGLVFATGSEDRKINLWSLTKQQAIMSLSGHTSGVTSVSFDSCEEVVVAGSSGGTLKLWNLDQQKVVRSLNGHKAACCAVDFHPHGEYFASGSQDTQVKLWDVRRKLCIHTYRGHQASVTCVRFTPDGRWLVSGCEDGAVMVWDLTAGKLLHTFTQHSDAITSLTFHPNDFLLATAGADKVVRFFDVESFEEISSSAPELTKAKSVCFSPDGRAMLAAYADSLRVLGWEPAEYKDVVPINWPGLLDSAVVKDQYVGFAANGSHVYIWYTPLAALKPFCEDTQIPSSAVIASVFGQQQAQPHLQVPQQQAVPQSAAAGPCRADKPKPRLDNTAEAIKRLNDTHRPQSRARKLLDEDTTPDDEGTGGGDKTPTGDEGQGVPNIIPLSWTRSSPARPVTPQQMAASHQLPQLVPPSTASGGGVIHVHASLDDRQSQQPTQQPPPQTQQQLPPPQTASASRHVSPPVSQRQPAPPSTAPVRASTPGHPPSTASQRRHPVRPSMLESVPEGPPPQSMQPPVVSSSIQAQAPMPMVAPPSRDRPADMNIRQFAAMVNQSVVPPFGGSEDQFLKELDNSHGVMLDLLAKRSKSLKYIRSMWASSVKDAIEALNHADLPVGVDVLNVMLNKPDLFTLERTVSLLPCITRMLDSPYEETIVTGLRALSLFAESFGPLIQQTLSQPAQQITGSGVDLSREDRVARCKALLTAFTHYRDKINSLSRRGGTLGPEARRLTSKLQAVSVTTP